ncbi:MAG TPA: hypothetical protein VME66_08440 [Candidatus Acidoferrales bacterium]|nr:hypothetical protein [Candidatus Acidoferrales bacterium]
MPTIVFSREIRLPADRLYTAVSESLDRIAAQSRTNGIAWSMPIGSTTQAVSVPVEIAVTKRSVQDPSIAVSIKARAAHVLFPEFDGPFHTLPMSAARTTLRLRGRYRVPLGLVGSTLNAAGLHRLAEENLRRFFDLVADRSSEAAREVALHEHATEAHV